MHNYYYILDSRYDPESFLKLGVTVRHPLYRIAEHHTTYAAYNTYCVIRLAYDLDQNEALQKLLQLEKYVLAVTIKYKVSSNINNECRRGIKPLEVQILAIDYLIKRNIKHEIVTVDSIEETEQDNEVECEKPTYFNTEADIEAYLNKLNGFDINVRDYQKEATDKALNHFNLNSSCILNWACGLGKTLTSLNILFEYSKLHVVKNILIGVPYNPILKQWLKVINSLSYFNKYSAILITSEHIADYTCTTNKALIDKLHSAGDTIILTTYHSSKLVVDLQFDFAIFDEVHHLAGAETTETTGFKMILQSNRTKTVSLSATLKDAPAVSNFNENIFGAIIDYKSIHWAIEKKFITDYSLLVMETQESVLSGFKFDDVNLFLSAWSVLYGISNRINNMSHTIIYTNSKVESDSVVQYIKTILAVGIFQLDNCYYTKIDSDINDVSERIELFKSYTSGIIVCVYMLGEGFDEPTIDSVCFGKQMISRIRSIQSLLRPNRLLAGRPDKINTVVFPTTVLDDVYNTSLGKLVDDVRNEDKNVEEKITGISITTSEEADQPATKAVSKTMQYNIAKKLLFRLFESKRMTKEQIFEKYAKYHEEFKFCSISDYKKLSTDVKYQLVFIQDPKEYFNEIWNRSSKYYGFLAIDTRNFPKDKIEWKFKCKALHIDSRATYHAVCQKNNMPVDYSEYYDICNGDEPWMNYTYADFYS